MFLQSLLFSINNLPIFLIYFISLINTVIFPIILLILPLFLPVSAQRMILLSVGAVKILLL